MPEWDHDFYTEGVRELLINWWHSVPQWQLDKPTWSENGNFASNFCQQTWNAASNCCLVASSSCLMQVMSWRSLEFSAWDSSHSLRMLSRIFGGWNNKSNYWHNPNNHETSPFRKIENTATDKTIVSHEAHNSSHRIHRGYWCGKSSLVRSSCRPVFLTCVHWWRLRSWRGEGFLLGSQSVSLSLALNRCWRFLQDIINFVICRQQTDSFSLIQK